MDGLELQQMLNDAMDAAFRANEEARKSGRALATANANYKAELAAEAARLKASGTPVTLIHDLAFKQRSVRTMRVARDAAEVEYKADMETVQLRKREVDILREEMRMDWAASGRIV